MFEFNNFDSIQIGVASPEKIREWSYGEVTKPETFNYRTQKPEMGGLFCDRIFGPTKDWECHCGKYKGIRYNGFICDKCGVEITKSKVRAERMGHIELVLPVEFYIRNKNLYDNIAFLLGLSSLELRKIIYSCAYIVLDPGKTNLHIKQVIDLINISDYKEKYGESFNAKTGVKVIKELLAAIDYEEEIMKAKEILTGDFSIQERKCAAKKIEVIEMFIKRKIRPEWVFLEVLPVIPPRFRCDANTKSINDFYRKIITINNHIKRMVEMGAPEFVIRSNQIKLQEEVNNLFFGTDKEQGVLQIFYKDILDKLCNMPLEFVGIGRAVISERVEEGYFKLPYTIAKKIFGLRNKEVKEMNKWIEENAERIKFYVMAEKEEGEVVELMPIVYEENVIEINKEDSLSICIHPFEMIKIIATTKTFFC